MQFSKRRETAKPMRFKVVRVATGRKLDVLSVNRLIALSAFGLSR
jgi:hypothetical protein